jgi:hypothetical protein
MRATMTILALAGAAAAQATTRPADLLEQRATMTELLLSGKLAPAQETQTRKALADIARKTLLSPRPSEGDPYAFTCQLKAGESVYELVRRMDLRIPAAYILQLNGLDENSKVAAGRELRMLRGPVCGVISKHEYKLDLYLQRDKLPPAYLRTVSVGIGKENRTPEGLFRVGQGRKAVHPDWDPPPSSTHTERVSYGQKGYPFGKVGLWIGLEGAEDQTRGMKGYALHSTADPTSIGKAKSLGCVRVGDKDIAMLYSMLSEKWSTVEIRP